MSRQSLKYVCQECGKSYEFDKGEANDYIKDKFWLDHDHDWPVWAICSDCLEDGESNLMWPEASGPKREMSCEACDFSVEYPEVLLEDDDSFKCPRCGQTVY